MQSKSSCHICPLPHLSPAASVPIQAPSRVPAPGTRGSFPRAHSSLPVWGQGMQRESPLTVSAHMYCPEERARPPPRAPGSLLGRRDRGQACGLTCFSLVARIASWSSSTCMMRTAINRTAPCAVRAENCFCAATRAAAGECPSVGAGPHRSHSL